MIGQMQLDVNIVMHGSFAEFDANQKSPEDELEEQLKWSAVALYGDKLNGFLIDTLTELSIGSDNLMKQLKAAGKKRKMKRIQTQCGLSQYYQNSKNAQNAK